MIVGVRLAERLGVDVNHDLLCGAGVPHDPEGEPVNHGTGGVVERSQGGILPLGHASHQPHQLGVFPWRGGWTFGRASHQILPIAVTAVAAGARPRKVELARPRGSWYHAGRGAVKPP